MSILYELPEILRQARQEAELLLETAREKKEKAGTEERWKNSFFLGDNAALLDIFTAALPGEYPSAYC